MKITKEMINNLIKEEIQNLNEGKLLFQSQLATKIFTASREAGMDNQQIAMELEKLAERYRNAPSTRLKDLGLDKVY
jgi:parvulin-like peptidyl-prolyl isomerase